MTVRERVHHIVDVISDEKLAEIVDFLEYIKVKEELEATNEILSDKTLLESFRRGLLQIEKGDVVDFEDVVEMTRI